ncbi:D-alanyl-D-alanine carboxypeptidase [Streptomyces sp. NPDC005017]|uniref:D-alanyl-D-alanine carboxypeptidase family protein n=1 Tax=Streptomyces sp. NPDC005017 TaxID=3364706 RepID=UPI003673E503
MAGESPDRSKQRESSAEPTPGTAAPVPEARDPRLAVARESGTTPPAPVKDTATQVLSLPKPPSSEPEDETEPEEPEEDARLRAAVAAWVTKGAQASEEPSEAPEDRSEAPSEAPEEPAEDSVEEETGDAAEDAATDEAAEPVEDGDASEDEDATATAELPADEPEAAEPADAASEEPSGEDITDDGDEDDGDEDTESGEPRADEADGTEADTEDEAEAADEPEAPAATAEDDEYDEDDDRDEHAPAGETPAPASEDVEDEDQQDQDEDRDEDQDADDEPEAATPAPAPAPAPAATPASRKPAPSDGAEATREKPAEPQPAPVDQPTSVFRRLGDVPDQPTTMLKLGAAERTTRQPLPPKPPLDLLAELTNTPPPPQTPLRQAARRVKIWTPLVLLLLIAFAVAQSLRPLPAPELTLTAKDSYTFDGDLQGIPWPQEGQAALDVQGIGSFGSSGEQKPVPIASVAKVMTAYVILRDHPLESGAEGPKIPIDQTAQDQSKAGQESTVDVTAGDSISQREALESILIASANNVARLLARWDAGSEKAFVEKMNAAAADLGMTNTTYTDPSGLNDTTVSTAVDQVKLGKAAMKEPAFREVAAMMEYTDYKGTKHPNWNQLVGKNDVVGIKTGTTTSALGNLLFAAKKEIDGETRTIVGAVVRQPPGGFDNTILQGALSASDELIRAAQDRLRSAKILKKGDVVGYVDDGLGGRTPVVATKDVTAVGWAGLKVELKFTADELPHAAKAGTQVGTLTVGDGGTAGAVKVPVALQSDLAEPGWTDKLTRIA